MPTQKQLPKSKGKLVSLLNVGNELRVDSRLLAEKLQNQHKHVYELIEKYFEQFCRFGKVPFETEPLPSGQKAKFALLNEDQSYFLLSLSRNTEHVVELKANLVAAFSKARQPQGPEEEYLPTYRALHDSVDSLASESKNKKFVHMNFNKLINSTVGVEAGKRHDLPVPRKALMVVAQATAAHALSTAKDHHDGYQLAKTAMQALKPVAQQLSGQTNLPIG